MTATQIDGRVIEIDDLTKRYGDLVAVDGISFSVARGEVFGILGPNGAGKTTTLEMVEGLRKPDGGSITVDGLPVWPNPKPVKRVIGVQLQATALFDYQRVWEIIYVFGSTYGIHRSRQECVTLLERVGIADKADAFANQLSGGQAQRLSIALALVNDPVVTFLDEPTTGLDPRARRALWDVIREINYGGTTVVLTSHYMEEAERLCDRVAVMDRGHIMDIGPPQQLINKLGAEAVVTFTLSRRLPLAELRRLEGVNDCRAQEETGYELIASDAQHVVVSLLDLARERDVKVENLDVKGATLEDVFLQLTGHKLADDEAEVPEGSPGRKRRFGLGGGRR
ncbi:MAG TPA: ABC transporter ATP-binding protein [Thermoleophilia bacterium]|nr:ABC transporter ATP-binding protein [Thermoleophilia bacterium]